MNLVQFLFYLAVGRLLTWLLQTNGLLRPMWQRHPRLTELSECDLCLGFWVYLALAFLWKGETPGLWPGGAEQVILAAIATLGAHLLRLGWWARFGVTVIE